MSPTQEYFWRCKRDAASGVPQILPPSGKVERWGEGECCSAFSFYRKFFTRNSLFYPPSVLFSPPFSRLKYEVSKHEQLRKIINLWPIWKREWGCQPSEMYAFSIWHFLMPASFFRRTVKLPFLLVLIEQSPRSLPRPSCIAHLSLFVGSQRGCPLHWLWESTSSYLFVPWHGHDALDQAGHLETGYRSRTTCFIIPCYRV